MEMVCSSIHATRSLGEVVAEDAESASNWKRGPRDPQSVLVTRHLNEPDRNVAILSESKIRTVLTKWEGEKVVGKEILYLVPHI
jgi:hypothetical protein